MARRGRPPKVPNAETVVATITGRVITLRSTTAGHEFLNATKRWVKVRM